MNAYDITFDNGFVVRSIGKTPFAAAKTAKWQFSEVRRRVMVKYEEVKWPGARREKADMP